MQPLSPDQHDAIAEILNMGIGSAASALSDMANDEVILSTPVLDFMKPDEVVGRLDASVGQEITAVRQGFRGAFPGDAMLLFPEHQSLELVRALLQDTVPLEAMTQMEQEAMCEVGNVLLNATLSVLADVLETEIETDLPESIRCSGQELIGTYADRDQSQVMFLRVDFALSRTQVRGYVAFLLDLSSIQELGRRIDAYLAKLQALAG